MQIEKCWQQAWLSLIWLKWCFVLRLRGSGWGDPSLILLDKSPGPFVLFFCLPFLPLSFPGLVLFFSVHSACLLACLPICLCDDEFSAWLQ